MRKKHRTTGNMNAARLNWPVVQARIVNRDQGKCLFCGADAQKAIPLQYSAAAGTLDRQCFTACDHCYSTLKLVRIENEQRFSAAAKLCRQFGTVIDLVIADLRSKETVKPDPQKALF